MKIGSDESRRQAARWVGIAYLLAILPAVFSEFYVFGEVLGADAAETVRNLLAHERLFRLGIASNLFVFAVDVVLIVALYVVLEPVDRTVALVAAGWRLVETAVLVVVMLDDFRALRVLTGADSPSLFEPAQAKALVILALAGHGAGYNLGLLFAGLGSTLFCWLWFNSGLIPKWLAAFGLFASLVLAARTGAVIVVPELRTVVSVAYYGGPIFLFEVTMGFWLLFRGVRLPTSARTGTGDS